MVAVIVLSSDVGGALLRQLQTKSIAKCRCNRFLFVRFDNQHQLTSKNYISHLRFKIHINKMLQLGR